MSQRMCIGGCGTEVTGRRKRCPECRRKLQRLLDKRLYHAERGQDASDYEHLDGDGEVVSYAHGGYAAPGLAPPVSYRANPRHDLVTRQRLDRAQADDDNELTSWDEMVAQPRNSGHFVDFHRSSTGHDFRGRDEVPTIDNWTVEGMAYRQSAMAGQSMMHGHQSDRFGGRVSPPQPPIHSSQLAAPPSSMVQAEAQVAAQERAASDHVRSMLPGRR